MPAVIGLDIGGTSLKLGAWDFPSATRVAWREGVSLPQSGDPREVLSQLAATVREFNEGLAEKPRALGIGSCGLIRSGVILESPNTPWESLPLSLPLSQATGMHVTVINDADAFLLGVLDPAGAAGRLILGITLGTGIGTAVWLGDRLLAGGSGISPEAGHITVDYNGEPGVTGIPGDWEHLAGKAGLMRAYERYGGLGTAEPHDIAAAAGMGDGAAITAWRIYGRAVGVGLASLCNIFSPSEIIISGGLAGASELFAPSMQAAMLRHMLAAMPRPQITFSAESPDLIALGAARHAAGKLEG